jgi:hypothetical protein
MNKRLAAGREHWFVLPITQFRKGTKKEMKNNGYNNNNHQSP